MSVAANKLKAAYIYRFISYIKWENPLKIIPVSIHSDSDIHETLSKMSIKKDKYDITRSEVIVPNSVVYLGCNLPLSKQNLKQYQDNSILTISSCENHVESGVIINFIEVEGKLKFKINNTSAATSKIKISSQLLKLALAVK
jgi:hypothetical protein